MLTYFLLILFTLVIVVLSMLLWRTHQSAPIKQSQVLKESLEGLQRNLSFLQQETEKTNENKASLLRNELTEQIRKNRVELHQGLTQTTQLLDQKVTAIDSRLDNRLGDLSKGVQDKLETNLKEGFNHFAKVQEHLKFSGQQLQNLSAVGQSINDLNNLLKLPHLRGNFGEASLERLLADLLPADSYELQFRIVPNSTERVDAVIKYPNYLLPIDSKFPREQVLPLFETNEPKLLEKARNQLAEVMKILARQIKEKYIRPEHGTTDMALLFVPSETLYFEILRNVKLWEALAKHKVFTVSPNTLAISMHSISMARDYYEMAQGVERTILEIKKAQRHFENFERRFTDVGKHLKRSQDAFDTASTHLGRYSGAANRLVGSDATTALPSQPDPVQEAPA